MPQPEYEDARVRLYCGDCIEVMRTMPKYSVDTVITDPPYGLEFMGKEWDRLTWNDATIHRGKERQHGANKTSNYNGMRNCQGINRIMRGSNAQEWHQGWATAAFRVAKPGAMLLAFGGTRTFHRMTCALENSGWEIRDCLMWLYGSGFPKSLNISKAIDRTAGVERPRYSKHQGSGYAKANILQGAHCRNTPGWNLYNNEPVTDAAKLWHGYGTALKPAWEPIIVAMKPLEGTFVQNAIKYEVAGLNIDGARVPISNNEPDSGAMYYAKRGMPMPENRLSYFGGKNGKVKCIPIDGGRWPANVIVSHHEDCKPDGRKCVKSNGHYPGKRGRGGLSTSGHKGQSELAEHMTCWKNVEKWDCHPDCPVRLLDKQAGPLSKSGDPRRKDGVLNSGGMFGAGKAKRIVQVFGDIGGASRFFYCTKASKRERNAGLPTGMVNDHPTVKPLRLMEYLCKLTGTPTGGLILDPFAGSGTTLLAARNVGRECIGIEKNPDYVTLAQERLKGGRYAKPCSKHCTQFCIKHSK
ncbi:MAG: site-specific DNA-methyltransferase [Planctomycetes bacterium]|nr:site-specific DNA-methyltransferase [Planctomycetota bacterium]